MHDSRGRKYRKSLRYVALRCVALPIFSQSAAVRFSTSDSGRRRSKTGRKKVGKLDFNIKNDQEAAGRESGVMTLTLAFYL